MISVFEITEQQERLLGEYLPERLRIAGVAPVFRFPDEGEFEHLTAQILIHLLT